MITYKFPYSHVKKNNHKIPESVKYRSLRNWRLIYTLNLILKISKADI